MGMQWLALSPHCSDVHVLPVDFLWALWLPPTVPSHALLIDHSKLPLGVTESMCDSVTDW